MAFITALKVIFVAISQMEYPSAHIRNGVKRAYMLKSEVMTRVSINISSNSKQLNQNAIKIRTDFTGVPLMCKTVCVSWCDITTSIAGTKEFLYGIFSNIGFKKQPFSVCRYEYSQSVCLRIASGSFDKQSETEEFFILCSAVCVKMFFIYITLLSELLRFTPFRNTLSSVISLPCTAQAYRKSIPLNFLLIAQPFQRGSRLQKVSLSIKIQVISVLV